MGHGTEKKWGICLILSPQYIKSIVLSQNNLTLDHQRKSLYPTDHSHENGADLLGTMQTIFFSIHLLIDFLIYLESMVPLLHVTKTSLNSSFRDFLGPDFIRVGGHFFEWYLSFFWSEQAQQSNRLSLIESKLKDVEFEANFPQYLYS